MGLKSPKHSMLRCHSEVKQGRVKLFGSTNTKKLPCLHSRSRGELSRLNTRVKLSMFFFNTEVLIGGRFVSLTFSLIFGSVAGTSLTAVLFAAVRLCIF